MAGLNQVIPSMLRSGANWSGRQRLAKQKGKLCFSGITKPVEILRDRYGVPHIYAQEEYDLFFSQGFVHAQDRFWQMDINRHTANGTLSEMFGEVTYETDRASRTFGFARTVKEDWDITPPNMQSIIQAYTDGVNAWICNERQKRPLEYMLLGIIPQPWKVSDSMAFSRLMCWQLSHAWYFEIVRARLLETVGLEAAAELDILYSKENPITLPQGIDFQRLIEDPLIQATNNSYLHHGFGSNAWVVDGTRSETGKPFLCNDIHMQMSLPGIWYQNHLVFGDLNVYGVSLPGLPCVLVGHNDRIAWGMTLAFTDCEDTVIEIFDPNNPHFYLNKDTWVEAQVITEEIHIKDKATPRSEEILVTRHGPIISDVINHKNQRLALQSMALRNNQLIMSFHLLNKANNWNDFSDAMRYIKTPPLSVSYADIDGNIGFWVTGSTPLRSKGNGSLPTPGWTGENEWIGEIPFDEMPHARNPKQGYIVTSNNKIVADDYSFFLGNNFMNGYRQRRLCQMIEEKSQVGIAHFRAMQTDLTSVAAREFIQHLSDLDSKDPDVRLALSFLQEWEGTLDAQSIGASVYEVARYTTIRMLIEPTLGKELTDSYMGTGFHPLLLPYNEFYGNDTACLFRLLSKENSWWVHRAGGKKVLLETGLKNAIRWLRAKAGENPGSWQWGKLHQITFTHVLGSQKPTDTFFNRGPYPIGGDTDTPLQTAMAPNTPYETRLFAPSMRFIIDLGDLSASRCIVPAGQSGQLGSAHYDDMIEPWLKGIDFPMLWTRDQVEQNLEARMELLPLTRKHQKQNQK